MIIPIYDTRVGSFIILNKKHFPDKAWLWKKARFDDRVKGMNPVRNRVRMTSIYQIIKMVKDSKYNTIRKAQGAYAYYF